MKSGRITALQKHIEKVPPKIVYGTTIKFFTSAIINKTPT
jgi:hypothetical protein